MLNLLKKTRSYSSYYNNFYNKKPNRVSKISFFWLLFACPVLIILSEFLAQAYLGFEGLGLAKDQFKFNKNLATTNLNNQIATIRYNIADRERTKLLANGVSNADVVAQQKAMDYTKDFRGI